MMTLWFFENKDERINHKAHKVITKNTKKTFVSFAHPFFVNFVVEYSVTF
jgi:hypothetical protein